jgi:hypothetical protein
VTRYVVEQPDALQHGNPFDGEQFVRDRMRRPAGRHGGSVTEHVNATVLTL